MKKVFNIGFILLIVIAILNCTGDVTLHSDLITTITMTKFPYKNDSDDGITSFSGMFVLNLEEVLWGPLRNGDFADITKDDISLELGYTRVEGIGDMPNLNGINSNVKFEIFVQDEETEDHFLLFYTTWNNSTGNEYITFEKFWDFSDYSDRDLIPEGRAELIYAFRDEREEVYLVFKLSFEEAINEDLLNFKYFDIVFNIPFEIEALTASN